MISTTNPSKLVNARRVVSTDSALKLINTFGAHDMSMTCQAFEMF
jgi:plasmid maintenance system antidote protein VapI